MYGSDYDPGGMSQILAQLDGTDAHAAPAEAQTAQPIGGVLQLRLEGDASQDRALPDHSQLVLAFQQAGRALRDQAGRLALARAFVPNHHALPRVPCLRIAKRSAASVSVLSRS